MRNTILDTIINSGEPVERDFRVLTTSIRWPAGEPPYTNAMLKVPTIVAGNIDNTYTDQFRWTESTKYVQSYSYKQDLNSMIDNLTLTLTDTTTSYELDKLFRLMRVIVVQERYNNVEGDTGWFNRCFCISQGGTITFNPSGQNWQIQAYDVLTLTNLNTIEDLSYYPSIKKFGPDYPLILVGSPVDAWEFGIVGSKNGTVTPSGTIESIANNVITLDPTIPISSTHNLMKVTFVRAGTNVVRTITSTPGNDQITVDRPIPSTWQGTPFFIGDIIRHWSSFHVPRIVITNVPDWSDTVPLAKGGDATQIVYGSGIVRLGKTYANSSPDTLETDEKRFERGLGYTTEIPTLTGTFYINYSYYWTFNWYVPFVNWDNPYWLGANFPKIISSGAGWVIVDRCPAETFEGLYFYLQDGSCRKYLITDINTGLKKITFNNSTIRLRTGLGFSCGNSNDVENILRDMLFRCGFHTDAQLPFAVKSDLPKLDNKYLHIDLPPLTYTKDDKKTTGTAIETLSKEGNIPPHYVTRANNSGQVEIRNIQQNKNVNEIINLQHVVDCTINKSSDDVYTRVVAKGSKIQEEDYTQTCLQDVVDGLPAAPGDVVGETIRTGTPGAYDVLFPLTRLVDRGIPTSLRGQDRRAWGWYMTPSCDEIGEESVREAKYLWEDAVLATFNFTKQITIHEITLDVSNTWLDDEEDYGETNHNIDPFDTHKRTWETQILLLEFFDGENWQPLTNEIVCQGTQPELLQLTSDQFLYGNDVTTNAIRIKCIQPFFADCYNSSSTYHALIGVYLNFIKVWSTNELTGEAEVGITPPFDTALWKSIKNETRTRTFYVPNVAYWADTQDKVNSLAIDWLHQCTRNLIPRQVTAFRPDVILGDTVMTTLPSGKMELWRYSRSVEAVCLWNVTFPVTTKGNLELVIEDNVIAIYNGDVRLAETQAVLVKGQNFLTPLTTDYISGYVKLLTNSPRDETLLIHIPHYLVVGCEYSSEGVAHYSLVNYNEPYWGGAL